MGGQQPNNGSSYTVGKANHCNQSAWHYISPTDSPKVIKAKLQQENTQNTLKGHFINIHRRSERLCNLTTQDKYYIRPTSKD